MKIHDFRVSTTGSMARISATVTWEDCDQNRQEIYLETDACFSDHLNCNPNTFLLAAIIPAMRRGERRVLVDGVVCPQLRNGLITAIQILERWYGKQRPSPLTIEATQGFKPRLPQQQRRTASFMSGGVDSLATLRCNRLDFPLDHPGSIQDCIFVHGFDMGGYESLEKNMENFELAVASLSEMAKTAKVTLIPVYTNMRYLEGENLHPYDKQLTSMGFHGQMFTMASHGAVMAGIGHGFSRRVTTILFASTASIFELSPLGSHPLLDPNYSSSEICIQHDGARFERIEKVGLIAEWDAALRTLRICGSYFRPPDMINCGKCEKCLRTMTELLVFDKLKQCPTFPYDDVSTDMLLPLRASLRIGDDLTTPILYRASVYPWIALIDPLRRIGRHDLAEIIEAKVKEYEKYQIWFNRKDTLKRFDDKYLGGILSWLNQRVKGKILKS
jgi:hypothetical protein